MGIDITDEAVEVLKRSLALGNAAGIRLRAARGLGGGVDVQVELADAPSEGETTIERDGLKIFVDPAVTEAIPDAIVTVEPQHEIVVVRPAS
jgi:Fe-S cluster assembly iron-binding protein IscA